MRGDSFRRQSALAADYAVRHGLTLDTQLTFNDLGVSAYRGRNAEAGRLADFLVAVEDGLVPPNSYLLVESLDRISRQAARKALRVLEDIVERGVTVVTLNDGKSYSADALDNDPMSLLLALLTFIRANEESATKSRRLTEAWRAKRATAEEKPLTNVCPAWLRLNPETRRFDVLPDRAGVVRRVYEMALNGAGQHAIAHALNIDGVPTFGHRGRKGQHWHRSYVVKLLASPAVIGTLIPHQIDYSSGRKRRKPLGPIANYYPAIIDPEIFQRVQALRVDPRNPRRGANAVRPVANILGGLAKCPLCGSTMTLATKGPQWRYLVCTRAKTGAGCRYHTVRYSDVEHAVVSRISQIIAECPTPGEQGEELDARIEQLDASLGVLSDELENLLDALTAHGRDLPSLTARIRQREAERDKLERELRELRERHDAVMGRSLRARLDTLRQSAKTIPLDRAKLNAAFRVLMHNVEIDWRNATLSFNWKHGGTSWLLYGWPDEPVQLHDSPSASAPH
jgi:DNA invertase Pin-like site-specific DNA recombinase